MPANTPDSRLPYPIPDDTVDVPRDIKALADTLDAISSLRPPPRNAPSPPPPPTAKKSTSSPTAPTRRRPGTCATAPPPAAYQWDVVSATPLLYHVDTPKPQRRHRRRPRHQRPPHRPPALTGNYLIEFGAHFDTRRRHPPRRHVTRHRRHPRQRHRLIATAASLGAGSSASAASSSTPTSPATINTGNIPQQRRLQLPRPLDHRHPLHRRHNPMRPPDLHRRTPPPRPPRRRRHRPRPARRRPRRPRRQRTLPPLRRHRPRPSSDTTHAASPANGDGQLDTHAPPRRDASTEQVDAPE